MSERRQPKVLVGFPAVMADVDTFNQNLYCLHNVNCERLVEMIGEETFIRATSDAQAKRLLADRIVGIARDEAESRPEAVQMVRVSKTRLRKRIQYELTALLKAKSEPSGPTLSESEMIALGKPVAEVLDTLLSQEM